MIKKVRGKEGGGERTGWERFGNLRKVPWKDSVDQG